jgi:predicted HTH transcriptional regulator
MVCVRELLANAVCHRDYSDSSRSIHLRVFDDRVEILSPGTWMGATALSGRVALSEARSESVARNATLARLLASIKFVEREGGGLSRAIAECATKGRLSHISKSETASLKRRCSRYSHGDRHRLRARRTGPRRAPNPKWAQDLPGCPRHCG